MGRPRVVHAATGSIGDNALGGRTGLPLSRTTRYSRIGRRARGKGQQKVTVEHVHVHQGGEAVVGAVSLDGTPGGEGDHPKTEA